MAFSKRSVLQLSIALLAGLGLPAQALDKPAGKVILTISGKVGVTNSPQGVQFDLAMLEKLPSRTFTTMTPWDKQPIKFTGPLLRDVLTVAKASGTTLKAVALNDYQTAIPADDAAKHDVIMAIKMNDEYIPVKTKGPLFIVYPYDTKPELKVPAIYERSAWQLKSLTVE